MVQLQKLDYVSSMVIPDLTEDYCIRFCSPSVNLAELADGEDPYLRRVSDDPLVLGEYVEVDDSAGLEELILDMASGEGEDDLPPELTLENIGDLWIELVQDTFEVTVHIGHDYVVEDKVNEEAGITGDKAIVLNVSDAPADSGENADANAGSTDEEVIE